jgi:hypothetical protein
MVVAAVVVAILVVGTVVLVRMRDGGKDSQGASASSTSVTLDTVIPGQGAVGKSSNIPSVGVNYADTCVGAAQASAGWTIDLLGGLTAQNGASVDTLNRTLESEVLAPSYERTPLANDPAESIVSAAKNWEADKSASPVNEVHLQYGAYKLVSCDEHHSAQVTVYGSVTTNGWRGGAPKTTDESTYEMPLVYSYKMTSVNGYWRIQAVADEVTADRHDGKMDYLKTWGKIYQETGTLQSKKAQNALLPALGSGGHAYVHGK